MSKHLRVSTSLILKSLCTWSWPAHVLQFISKGKSALSHLPMSSANLITKAKISGVPTASLLKISQSPFPNYVQLVTHHMQNKLRTPGTQ